MVHYTLSKVSYVAKTFLNLEHPISKKAKICKNIERICLFYKTKEMLAKPLSFIRDKEQEVWIHILGRAAL